MLNGDFWKNFNIYYFSNMFSLKSREIGKFNSSSEEHLKAQKSEQGLN
jgi:hypothetical protein